jgi:CRP/FNR family transcriptional regulator
MFDTAISSASVHPSVLPAMQHIPQGSARKVNARARVANIDPGAYRVAHQRISDGLKLLQDKLAPQRKVVRAGDVLYQAGERFVHLYIVNSGIFKMLNLSLDGREQVSALKFRGDWMGFDGIAEGQYGSDAVAMDTGEVWMVRYDDLIASMAAQPAVTALMHEAMSRQLTRERDSLMSVCTLPADARVADFLRYWADALARRGLRSDQITLRMTRAEIGNYLGMTLETVSRALSKLARANVIAFSGKGRREISIPDLSMLVGFIQDCVSPDVAPVSLQ